MANLNFEQPPRSIANASLNTRGGSGGGLSSTTLTGHVTPTSGMFSGSSTSTSTTANTSVIGPNVYPGGTSSGGVQPAGHQPQQQQLSPMGSRGLFGQRAFTDRRTMPALGSVLTLILIFLLQLLHNNNFTGNIKEFVIVSETLIQWVVWVVLEYLQAATTDLKEQSTISIRYLAVVVVGIPVLLHCWTFRNSPH